jgi:hypothetical protein
VAKFGEYLRPGTGWVAPSCCCFASLPRTSLVLAAAEMDGKEQPSLDNNAQQPCNLINNRNPCYHHEFAFTNVRSVGG